MKRNPKETELIFDLSESKDGSVMSYLVTNEDSETYTLYLQSDGGIKANKNSYYLFYGYSKLESIEGMENFDTSNVTDMSSMFSNCPANLLLMSQCIFERRLMYSFSLFFIIIFNTISF